MKPFLHREAFSIDLYLNVLSFYYVEVAKRDISIMRIAEQVTSCQG